MLFWTKLEEAGRGWTKLDEAGRGWTSEADVATMGPFIV